MASNPAFLSKFLWSSAACVAAALAWCAAPASAQNAAETPADPPGELNAAQEGPPAADPDVAALMGRLSGAYRGDEHVLRVTPIATSGMPQALYVELTRENAPLAPMDQQIWTVWKHEGRLRVRLCQFSAAAPFGVSYVAAWAAPDSFPRLSPDRVDPVIDLSLDSTDSRVALKTPSLGPIFRAGAVGLDLSFELSGDTVTWRSAGVAPDGEPLWGGDTLTLRRFEPDPVASPRANGLVVIDLRPGEGVRAAVGDSIAMHLDGYTFAGLLFISSGLERTQAWQMQIPGDVPAGINEGVLGMQEGSVRRLIVPPWLGFDVPGVQRPPAIPENAWLFFDIECVSIRDNTPEPREDDPVPGRGLPIPLPGVKPPGGADKPE